MSFNQKYVDGGEFQADCVAKVFNPYFFEMYTPMGATGTLVDSDRGHATVLVNAVNQLEHQSFYDFFSETLFTVLVSCSWSLIFALVVGCYFGYYVFRSAYRRQKTKLMLKIMWLVVKVSVFETYRQIKRKLLSCSGKLVASAMLHFSFLKRKQSIAVTKIGESTVSSTKRVVMKRPRVSNMFDASETMEKTTQNVDNYGRVDNGVQNAATTIKPDHSRCDDDRTILSPLSVAPAVEGPQSPSPAFTENIVSC